MGGEEAVQAGNDLYPVLVEILSELQAVRADMSGLASHGDMLIVSACLLLLVGVVVGVILLITAISRAIAPSPTVIYTTLSLPQA